MSDKFKGITQKLGLQPQEAMQLVSTGSSKLFIGIPKDRAFQEHRIGLTPQAVKVLTARGCRVLIERNAGKDSHFYDTDYSEAGAELADRTEQVYEADLLVKVAPPNLQEMEWLKMGQTIISPIHLPTFPKEVVAKMIDKRVTALAFEYIKDNSGLFPIVRAMSQIAGSNAVLMAANLLSKSEGGKGILLGGVAGVPPANVVIIGAGVVGTYAALAALGVGATIKVFDNNIYKLTALQNMVGSRVFASTLAPDILQQELASADVVIGAIHAKKGRSPIVVTEEMVAGMKAGSVIIDVSIDQGGCVETSEVTDHEHPTFKKYDVVHYCVPNIPSQVSRTASQAFSNILLELLIRQMEMGDIQNLLYHDAGLRNGVYLMKGHCTNKHLSEKFGFKETNLDLLFAGNPE